MADLIIGVDLQTLETPEAHRGIGRYTRGLTEHLASNCPHHRIVGFGFTDKPPLILRCSDRQNFEYRQFDLPHDRLAYLSEGILAPFGWSQQMRDLDAYIVTSPLMSDILLPDAGTFPILCVIHDLIPLVYRHSHPDQMTPYQWQLYEARLDVVKGYDQLIADSEATRRDVCRLLGIAPERIMALGVGIDEEFGEKIPADILGHVREKYSIARHYVLSLTGHHYRKNWEAVIGSFAALPASVQRKHQLVIVCKLDTHSRQAFCHLADSLGVTSQTVLTDAVDDESLRALYQGASAFIFPPFYEGFGIPLLEAMACGVPIVASDIAVLREVADNAASYADPNRTDLLAEALHMVLNDEQTRQNLIEQGRHRVQHYYWPCLIERLEALVNKVVGGERNGRDGARPSGSERRRPRRYSLANGSDGARSSTVERVAYFTLLLPQVSGIADYNQSLVRELAKHVRLELFLDDIVPDHPDIRNGICWRSSRDFPRLHRERPYDLIVTHMGNNVLHGRQYRMATTYPGIVMLHDYSLRFFPPLHNLRFSSLETRDDIEHYYRLKFPPATSFEQIMAQLDLLDHPLNEKLIERSIGLLVHSQWARGQILRRFPDKPAEVVPFGVDPDPRQTVCPREEIRQRYHISPSAFVVTCAGNLTPTKRLTVILYTFATFADEVPEATLILVGQATDPRFFYRLNQLASDLRLAGRVHFLGYVDVKELYDVLDMSDVCVNLRYPTLGETSAVLVRMMYLGKPTIVSAVAQFMEFPDTACWKVDVNGSEGVMLLSYLRALHRSPDLRSAMGENARRYVQQWTWDRAARLHIEAWRRIARHHKAAVATAKPKMQN